MENRPRVHRVLTVTTLAALVLAFGLYVWPTAYRPLALKNSRAVLAARENRVTHRVDVLTKHGWYPLTPHAIDAPPVDTTDPVATYLARYGNGPAPDSVRSLRRRR